MSFLRGKGSNKRVRGSSSTNPHEEEKLFNQRHPSDIASSIKPKLSLEKLRNKRIIGHRTIDWIAMATLGFGEEFSNLLTEDWKRFFAIRTPVFKDLVLEFFSTFRMDVNKGNTIESAMTFRLGGSVFTMSIAEFGVKMGLYTEKEVLTEDFTRGLASWPSGENAGTFWTSQQLGPNEYNIFTKQSSIVQPQYRILLRVIAESISNRENCTGNATQQDLFYLYCILTHRPCNLARCLAIYLYERGHGKKKGAIAGGSFVCNLAFRLGVANRERLETSVRPVAVVGLIGIAALKNIRILDSSGNLVDSSEDGNDPEQVHGLNLPPPQQDDPYSMQSIARQLSLIQQSQQDFHSRYDGDQQRLGDQFQRLGDQFHRIDSQLDWLIYNHTRYLPYMEHWAKRESDSMGVPLPAYSPPDFFIPPHYQGGFYYPPQQPREPASEAGGPSSYAGPLRFGTFSGGGTQSVFQDPHDMDEKPHHIRGNGSNFSDF